MNLPKKKILITSVVGLIITATVSGILIFSTIEVRDMISMSNNGTLGTNGYRANITYSFNQNQQLAENRYQLNYTFDLVDDTGYDPRLSENETFGYCFFAYIIGFVDNSILMTFQSINETTIKANGPIIEKTLNLSAHAELSVVNYGFHLAHYIMKNESISFISYSFLNNRARVGPEYLDYVDLFVPDKNNHNISVNLILDELEIEMEMSKCMLNSSSQGPYYYINGSYTQSIGEDSPGEQNVLQFLKLDYRQMYYNVPDPDSDDSLTSGSIWMNASNFLEIKESEIYFNTSGPPISDQYGVIDIPERVSTTGFKFRIGYRSILNYIEVKIGDPTYIDFLRESGEMKNIAGFHFESILWVGFLSITVLFVAEKRGWLHKKGIR